jgi:hypothetical protein
MTTEYRDGRAYFGTDASNGEPIDIYEAAELLGRPISLPTGYNPAECSNCGGIALYKRFDWDKMETERDT